MRSLLISLVLFACSTAALAQDAPPQVLLQTSMGDIVIELNTVRAPATVANFLGYVDDGFYDGTIFHRVIPDFMIQGGGFSADFDKKPTRAPIQNEADNGLKNERGTIAMARTSDPHSATAQFFINTVDNEFLDFKARDARGWGYAVFGRVIAGMHVVDAINATPTSTRGRYQDVPRTTVTINSAARQSTE